jgi:DNA-binding IclR family transcriptional regulator
VRTTVGFHVGEIKPAFSTGLPALRVLLAALDADNARATLGHKLPRVTERTITDLDKLLRSFNRVRSQGFATVREENLPGVLSVGAPVHDASGAVVAAISVAHARSLDPALSLEAMTPHVVEAANNVSRALGWFADIGNRISEPVDAAE